MNSAPYQLKLAVFEGPFDLLLYLIKKNQIDIYDIPIARITEEYLEYVEIMKKLNLNIASEFIIIAATLLYIKSKMLLPKDELLEQEEEDPREGLVQHLIEYNTFREISGNLRVYETKKRELFERLYPINVAKEDKELNLDVYALVKAMDEVLGRIRERKLVIIPGETVKVRDRMFELINILKKREKVSFFEIAEKNGNKPYVIALFLAILELLRFKAIFIKQDRLFGDINIHLTDNEFDESLIMGVSQ